MPNSSLDQMDYANAIAQSRNVSTTGTSILGGGISNITPDMWSQRMIDEYSRNMVNSPLVAQRINTFSHKTENEFYGRIHDDINAVLGDAPVYADEIDMSAIVRQPVAKLDEIIQIEDQHYKAGVYKQQDKSVWLKLFHTTDYTTLHLNVGMMDGIRERSLTTVAIVTHFVGGLCAGVFAHLLFLAFGAGG